jgi:hypothetical protein
VRDAQPVGAGQSDVEHHDGGPFLPEHGERGESVGDRTDPEAVQRQRTLERTAHRTVVLDDEDERPVRSAHACS